MLCDKIEIALGDLLMTSSYTYSEELSEELNEIFESFYNRIEHPYLKKYIEEPSLDKDQGVILFSMMKEKQLSSSYINKCVITAYLVQAALDTHEKVSADQQTEDSHKKKRQLRVLAGDYYSSLYYFILSKINDLPMIRALACSIKEINEAKMSVYQNKKLDYYKCAEQMATIDSSVVQHVAGVLNLPDWKKAAKEFFLLKRLLTERTMLMREGKKGPLALILASESYAAGRSDQYVDDLFIARIETVKDRIYGMCAEGTTLQSIICSRVDELLEEVRYEKQCVAEEG
jgi:heptaprenyl diphosphate synthase